MSTFGPWYKTIKHIKGHAYNYDQRTRREGKSILTQNIYQGRADGTGGPIRRRSRLAENEPSAVTMAGMTTGLIGRGEVKPETSNKATAPVVITSRARDRISVDTAAEQKLIESVFDPAKKAATWKRPWLGGRYTGAQKWMPDKRLYQLALKVGVGGKSSPFGGIVDFGWRRKRYEPKAAYSPSRNMLEIPDPTRFKGNAHATAEQNFVHTFLHEIAHATSRRPECERQVVYGFGSFGYAREEWVAELTAHIMAHRLGLARIMHQA